MVIKEKTCKETKDVLEVNRKWTVVLEGQNVSVGKGGPFITRHTHSENFWVPDFLVNTGSENYLGEGLSSQGLSHTPKVHPGLLGLKDL